MVQSVLTRPPEELAIPLSSSLTRPIAGLCHAPSSLPAGRSGPLRVVLPLLLLLLVAPALGAAACGAAKPAIEGAAAEVRALTGAPTRVVWVQGDGTDPFAEGQNLILKGFDTEDGAGERVILGERGSYRKPLFMPRGDRIVFSKRSPEGDEETFIVNWDGSGLRRLAPGFALAVWRDPAGGDEWIYVGLDKEGDNYRIVRQFTPGDPEATSAAWNRSAVSADSFDVSDDGLVAGGLFPWPEAGIADLRRGSWRKLGEGCWTALNEAGRPLFWYFDGSHRNLTVVDVEQDRRWTVAINGAPGFENPEVYHPRWTNHPRFMTMTGPYNQGGDNQVRSGGAQSEVWLGRFSDDYARIEAWARVTKNEGGDAYPDVWIDREDSPHPVQAVGTIGPAPAPVAAGGGKEGPASAGGERLAITARLVKQGTIPSPRSIAPYRNALVVSVYEIVGIESGSYGERQVLVAQWAIRDGRVLAEARKAAGSVHELTLEPYDLHPELEGERLMMDAAVPGLRLYYEVGAP